MVVRHHPVPLYVQIQQDLRERIRSGTLPEDARMPSESELAAEFGVSRMTARKALDPLADEGLITRRPGKGTFVATAKLVHGLSTALSFSHAIEDLGLDQATRVLHAQVTPGSAWVCAMLGLTAGASVVHIERVRIVAGEPVALHTAWLPVRFAAILGSDLERSLTDSMRRFGAVVDRSQDSLESLAATSRQADLLDVEEGSPVLRVSGVAYGPTGEPLRCTDAFYRGDRFKFVLSHGDQPSVWIEVLSPEAAAG